MRVYEALNEESVTNYWETSYKVILDLKMDGY